MMLNVVTAKLMIFRVLLPFAYEGEINRQKCLFCSYEFDRVNQISS